MAVALQQGHAKVVEVLLDPGGTGKLTLPPLHLATRRGDTRAVSLLVQKENINSISKVSADLLESNENIISMLCNLLLFGLSSF